MNTLALLICSAVGLGLIGIALSLFTSHVPQGWRLAKNEASFSDH
jgi:hypothetical protein